MMTSMLTKDKPEKEIVVKKGEWHLDIDLVEGSGDKEEEIDWETLEKTDWLWLLTGPMRHNGIQ